MKRLGWKILAFILSLTCSVPASAIETIPTSPNKITSPLLITAYSFSGPQLRFVQLFNNSSAVVSLDGWQITSTTKTAPIVTTTYVTMSGLLEPGRHVFAAIPGTVDRYDFTIPAAVQAASPLVGSVSLVALYYLHENNWDRPRYGNSWFRSG